MTVRNTRNQMPTNGETLYFLRNCDHSNTKAVSKLRTLKIRHGSTFARILLFSIATSFLVWLFITATVSAFSNAIESSDDFTSQSTEDRPAQTPIVKADSPDETVDEDDRASTNATYIETMILELNSGSVTPRSFTGVLNAKRTSEMGFKRLGRIERMLVDQGDWVDKGDVLAELDKATLESNLAVLQAQRNAAVSRLRELVAGPRKQTIDAARAQVREVESMRELAQVTNQRRLKLAGTEAISKQDLDDSRHQLAASEGRLNAQKELLSELEAGTRQEQIDAQRAMVEQIEATIVSQEIELKESTLVAPYNAVVARRVVDEGTVVAPGITILKLTERESPEAWIGLPPDIAATLQIGQKHSFSIRDQKWNGKLKAFLPELDAVSRTQTLIFTLDAPMDVVPNAENQPADLSKVALFGQIVQLHLTQESKQSGFWIPMRALVRGSRGLWSAYTVIEETESKSAGKMAEKSLEPKLIVQRNDVEIIQIDSDRVLTRGTLKSGDRIVTAGVQKLTPGQHVRLAPPSVDHAMVEKKP